MDQRWTGAGGDRAVDVLVRAVLVVAAAAAGLVGTAGPVVAGAPAPQPSWTWPLPGPPVVVRPFLPPPEPWLRGHRGVDLAAAPGSPVLAAGSGTVTFAGQVAGRGVVVVGHGALRTTYEPVSALVPAGTPVRRGTRIGTLATGAGHCPPRACLHWGLRRGETYLDPLRLVRRPVLRLLPPTGDVRGDGSLTPLLSRVATTGVATSRPAGPSIGGAVPRDAGRWDAGLWAALLLALLAVRAARGGARRAGRSPSARCRPPPIPGRSPARGTR